MKYIQVAVNVLQVSGVFDYHVPPELETKAAPGCMVIVPFGKQTVQGIVLQAVDEPQVAVTRPVHAILDTEPVVTQAQMQLAQWLANCTLTPIAACLDLMIPPGIRQHADTLYRLNPQPPEGSEGELTPLQKRLVSCLQRRGDLRGRQLDTAVRGVDWKLSAQALARRGWLTTQPVLPPPIVKPRMVRTAQLACSPADAQSRLLSFASSPAGQRRRSIVEYLIAEPALLDVAWVYASIPGSSLTDLRKLADDGFISLGETEFMRDPVADIQVEHYPEPELTAAQVAVWSAIQDSLQRSARGQESPPVLLHGVTGSGKTEIYLQAVAEALNLGRQAIVLVPEIALTPQTLRRFAGRFPGQVGMVHSRLSPGERYDTWRRARAGLLPVIIGPRSALFSPLPNPGIIVIDECHDDSYYQSESPPFYHTVETAIEYARLSRSLIILGSATPGVSLSYRAERERWTRLSLPVRIFAHRRAAAAHLGHPDAANPQTTEEENGASLPLPPVTVVDMRQELIAGNRSIFSKPLQESLQAVLAANQQAILFLNRRGSATYVFCRACGSSVRCPSCDFPLTLHLERQDPESGEMLCHICNYRRRPPQKCPQCGSNQIRHYGAGTEKVEAEVQSLFPQARTLRWDAETTRRKGAHDLLLAHFSQKRADVLIGTQMLAKGLDLPLVTLVGVVLADVGLNFPDYRAGERVFNLLTQVSGRAGRSQLGGRVILQTFMPEHPVIQAAAGHDFESFYHWELDQRRRLKYPPFYRLARLEYRHRQEERAAQTAADMALKLQQWMQEGNHTASELIGPTPCYFKRVKGFYRWQIALRSPDPLAILRGQSLEEWRVEIDPVSLL
ncbi:MAG: primosomal protein N' [Anaerolineaceae bacterium]|nr:primosomal protein N' [Anaerolineaceae bacterium]